MDKKELCGMAWVINGYRPIYDAREVRRGKNKGCFVCYIRRGYGYKKVMVKEFKKNVFNNC